MDFLCDEGDYICQEQDLNAMSGPTRQQENERSVGLGTQLTSYVRASEGGIPNDTLQ